MTIHAIIGPNGNGLKWILQVMPNQFYGYFLRSSFFVAPSGAFFMPAISRSKSSLFSDIRCTPNNAKHEHLIYFTQTQMSSHKKAQHIAGLLLNNN
jgi:hypothetical protein